MYSFGDTCEEMKAAKYVYQPVIAWLYAFDELLVLLRQSVVALTKKARKAKISCMRSDSDRTFI